MAGLIARSPDVIVRFDPELRFLFANEAIRAFSDVDPASLIGRGLDETRFFAGDADDRYRERLRGVFATAREATHLDTVVTELGEFVLHCRFLPELDAAGGVASVLCVTRDVTSLLRGEIEWAGTEALNRSLLDSMPDCLLVVDRDGVILTMNAAGRRLMEIPPDTTVVGEHWSVLWPAPARTQIAAAVGSAVAGTVATFTTMAPTLAGNPRWWATVVAPVVAGDGPTGQALVLSRDVTEVHVGERALEVSRGRFQRLYDANVIGMVFFNLDGRLVGANQAYLALTGLDQADFATGRLTMEAVTPPRYWAKDRGALANLGALGVWEPYEKEIVRRDGTVVPVLVGGAATPGDVADGIAYVVDLTSLRATEGRLHERERQLELLLSAGTIGLWWGNLELGETHWTDEYRAIMCLPPDAEPSVDLWRGRVHPEDREAVEEAFRRSLADRTAFDLEYRLLLDDRSLRWVRSTGRTDYAPNGAPVRSIGLVTDVTDRASAERGRLEALQRERDAQGIALAAEAQFRSLFNGAAESILVADDGGRIIAANPGAEELLGYPERELTSFSVDDVAPRGHLLMGYAPRDGKPSRVRSGEHEVVRRGGGVVRVESRSRAVRTADGSVLHYISLRDVSERRLLEQIHQESIDSISHDLKNPLAAIRAQAQLLRRRVERNKLDDAYLVEAMASINGSVERMTTQLDDLLEVARLRAGAPLELRRSDVDLGRMVEQWAADYQRTTERHIVAVDPIDEPVVCSVDVNRIERVVTNLLSNAIKYSDGGVIRIAVGMEPDGTGRSAAISVIDQGLGIPADEVPLVFERFRRGSNVDGRAGGSGIGLAGVRQIVQQHGGTIGVESKVGVGSAFTVRLPCGDESMAG